MNLNRKWHRLSSDLKRLYSKNTVPDFVLCDKNIMFVLIDLRINYLEFRKLELLYQSADFTRSKVKKMYMEMQRLMKMSNIIDDRLRNLTDGYLKDGACEQIISYKNEKYQEMFAKLKNAI